MSKLFSTRWTEPDRTTRDGPAQRPSSSKALVTRGAYSDLSRRRSGVRNPSGAPLASYSNSRREQGSKTWVNCTRTTSPRAGIPAPISLFPRRWPTSAIAPPPWRQGRGGERVGNDGPSEVRSLIVVDASVALDGVLRRRRPEPIDHLEVRRLRITRARPGPPDPSLAPPAGFAPCAERAGRGRSGEPRPPRAEPTPAEAAGAGRGG